VTNVFISDLHRYGKNKLFYGIAVFTSLVTSVLVMVIRQDIRLGFSIFGNLTVFRDASDIIRTGADYRKGLGVLIAVLISLFIGQEYQWKTWQHKWLASRSRTSLYLSKAVLSSAVSIVIFLLFQFVVWLGSGQTLQLLNAGYGVMMICSIFIYAALGSVLCLLAMLIKNSTASAVVCLGYVLLSETLVSVIRTGTAFSVTAAKCAEWAIRHSVYGMSSAVSGTAASPELIMPLLINSAVIILLSTAAGLFFFNKYEL
jgi:hypothetical protein